MQEQFAKLVNNRLHRKLGRLNSVKMWQSPGWHPRSNPVGAHGGLNAAVWKLNFIAFKALLRQRDGIGVPKQEALFSRLNVGRQSSQFLHRLAPNEASYRTPSRVGKGLAQLIGKYGERPTGKEPIIVFKHGMNHGDPFEKHVLALCLSTTIDVVTATLVLVTSSCLKFQQIRRVCKVFAMRGLHLRGKNLARYSTPPSIGYQVVKFVPFVLTISLYVTLYPLY